MCGGIWVGFSEEEGMLNWDQEGEENMARQKKKKWWWAFQVEQNM